MKHPDRPLPTDTQDLLRIAVYQMRMLDRVPDHAAVDTAVELAHAIDPARVKMVNAVLRVIGRTGVETEEMSLAERWSHPDWLVDRWTGRLGAVRTRAILAHNNTRPSLRLVAAAGHHADLASSLGAAGVAARVSEDRSFHIPSATVSGLPGYREGWFFVQDATQSALLAHAAVPSGELVWDACAAPGGKTMSLIPDRPVIASDRSRARLRRLQENLARLHLTVPVFAADLQAPPIRAHTIPCVLVDAPCSATGTLARHPDARWRLTPADIAGHAETQADLLTGAARVVQPGGWLVYLTCSIEPEENGDQVNQFLTRHPEFRRARTDLEILPGSHGADGGFVGCLERAA